MKIEAVCFDMDGTLIRNTDSVGYLCMLNGKSNALREIKKLESSGRISRVDADHLKARLIKGLSIADVENRFGHDVKLNRNID